MQSGTPTQRVTGNDMKPSPGPRTFLAPSIAVVGGTDYVEADLEAFLYKLHSKYPEATIRTGNGRGAEKAVKTLLEALGQPVFLPPLRPDLYLNPLDCQINDILIGADVIVVVGNPDSSRPKRALDLWKRLDSWREPELQRRLVQVAAPPKKKVVKKHKATKRREQLAA